MATQVYHDNSFKRFNQFKRSRDEGGYSNYSNRAKQGKFYNSNTTNYNHINNNSRLQKFNTGKPNSRWAPRNQEIHHKKPENQQLIRKKISYQDYILRNASKRNVDDIVKSLFSNEAPTTSSASFPVLHAKKQEPETCHKKTTSSNVPRFQSAKDEDEVDVQEEWRKYKAANPPLGGFPVRNASSKTKK